MEAHTFQTAHGPVVVRGDLGSFSTERPLLLLIRGAFPIETQFLRLGEHFPHADYAICDLPGMHSPFFAEPSVAAFAAGFDEVLALAFGTRLVNILGLSLGGVVALAMRSPQVRAVIAVDPPLSTAHLWPMRQDLERGAQISPQLRAWIWGLFGVDGAKQVERDYAFVLDGQRPPTRVLLASDPLMPEREVTRMPSLVGERDRALYASRPISLLTVMDTGHNIARDGQPAIMTSLRQALPA